MKKLLLVLPYLFSALFSFAQAPNENSLLWKISGNGLTSPSYLYGTIHLMCPDDIDIRPNLSSAFNKTQQLYLEVDMDDLTGMAKMVFGMMMTDGSTLKTLLDEKDYDSLAVIYKKQTGMSLGAMSRMKPIMLMSTIYPSLLGCQPEGWEQAFMKMAKEKKMELLGLEKVEDQISVLDSIPYKVQAEMFLKTMYNLDSTKASFEKMVEVYKKQDLQQLNEMTTSDEDYGDYEDIMLEKRNRNWIPVMTEAMKEKPSFFAVGAAHLVGDHGVINLLRQKGYKVTPVKY
jgi:uncharacterized protein YbaP (TraB family)